VRKMLVLAGVAGLLTVTACGNGDAGSPAASTAPAATTASAAAVKSDPSTLGPEGYAGIKLGASAAEVKAAGLDVDDPTSPCDGYAEVKGPKGWAGLLISAKDGVYLISARDPEATPEGVKLGSTLAEVKKAYPQMTDVVGNPAADDDTTRVVRVPGNPKAKYEVIMKNGKVDALDLRLKDCTD
jgi:hypothetical protein